MEKIILAIDGMKPEPSTLDFACYVGRLTHSKITGLFLENLVADNQFVLQQEREGKFASWTLDESSDQYRQKMKVIDENIKIFRESCERKSVQCSIHVNPGAPAEAVIRESRYADLVVIDGKTSFSPPGEEIPTRFAREILRHAECPVLIAPENFKGIDEIIFAWDGSNSSMFAIKQFCYLFPRLDEQKMTVLSVAGNNSETDDDESEKFKEWIRGHYSSIGYDTKEGDAETVLFATLFKKKNVLMVMGAYGRNAISQFFHHSRANILLNTTTQGFFIAHR